MERRAYLEGMSKAVARDAHILSRALQLDPGQSWLLRCDLTDNASHVEAAPVDHKAKVMPLQSRRMIVPGIYLPANEQQPLFWPVWDRFFGLPQWLGTEDGLPVRQYDRLSNHGMDVGLASRVLMANVASMAFSIEEVRLRHVAVLLWPKATEVSFFGRCGNTGRNVVMRPDRSWLLTDQHYSHGPVGDQPISEYLLKESRVTVDLSREVRALDEIVRAAV